VWLAGQIFGRIDEVVVHRSVAVIIVQFGACTECPAISRSSVSIHDQVARGPTYGAALQSSS
jgi:hypothetical protein